MSPDHPSGMTGAGHVGKVSLWGGRFAGNAADALTVLSRSTHFDWRLAPYDIAGSRAHARALHHSGLLDDAALDAMLTGLEQLLADVRSGAFGPEEDDEDVHTALERGLIERVGADVGGRLRAGRSRNDQVATLFRMYLRDHARSVSGLVLDVVDSLVGQADEHIDVAMPGRTHMQHAQPVLLAHHLLAHAWALLRDVERWQDWDRRTALSPYGSGALAGTSLGLDPEMVAADLGFAGAVENSIDGTSSRDFVAEFAFVNAMAAVDISRLAEEVVLWATKEFSYITLDDAYSTGSSIMPQKKNPDVAELVRGRAGRIIGDLVAVLTTLKGLPLAYDGDLQEQRVPLYDAATVAPALDALALVIRRLRFDRDAMRQATERGMLAATDLADHLVAHGVPFREAHEIVGQIVRHRLGAGTDLAGLTVADLRRYDKRFGDDAADGATVARSLAARRSPGGTSPERVREALAEAKAAFGQ